MADPGLCQLLVVDSPGFVNIATLRSPTWWLGGAAEKNMFFLDVFFGYAFERGAFPQDFCVFNGLTAEDDAVST